MSHTDKLREIAFKWGCRTIPSHDFTDDKYEDKSKELLSDLTALISEHYVPKDDYDKLGRLMDQLAEADEKQTSELLRQRDELREALADMVSQFAYRGTYEGRENLHTGGLSALESAFDALGLSDPITVLDFEAAIKNTEG